MKFTIVIKKGHRHNRGEAKQIFIPRHLFMESRDKTINDNQRLPLSFINILPLVDSKY